MGERRVWLGVGLCVRMCVRSLAADPADTVVTRLATGGYGRDWRGALDEVLDGSEGDRVEQAKVSTWE